MALGRYSGDARPAHSEPPQSLHGRHRREFTDRPARTDRQDLRGQPRGCVRHHAAVEQGRLRDRVRQFGSRPLRLAARAARAPRRENRGLVDERRNPHREVRRLDRSGRAMRRVALAIPSPRPVAGFLVALQRRAIQLLCDRHALDSVPDAFVEAYTASGPPGALANLRLYRALACLSWARRDLDKQTPELAEFMVDEALRLMSH